MMGATSGEGLIRSILGNLEWTGAVIMMQRSETLLLDPQVAQK